MDKCPLAHRVKRRHLMVAKDGTDGKRALACTNRDREGFPFGLHLSLFPAAEVFPM